MQQLILILPDFRLCKQGFDDTLRFLQKRYLISCTRCLAVDSTYEIGNNVQCSFQSNYLRQSEAMFAYSRYI